VELIEDVGGTAEVGERRCFELEQAVEGGVGPVFSQDNRPLQNVLEVLRTCFHWKLPNKAFTLSLDF